MSVCPICNGFATYEKICPKCSQSMTDGGRLADYYLDYSPYREIDHIKMSNGYNDVQNHECTHLTYCPSCGFEDVVAIGEIEQ
jgi:hypothetical protein